MNKNQPCLYSDFSSNGRMGHPSLDFLFLSHCSVEFIILLSAADGMQCSSTHPFPFKGLRNASASEL